MTDLSRLTATETLSRVQSGRTDPREVAEALLEAVAARENVLRAFTWHDPEAVRAQAARAKGPLAGIHLGVKDVLDTADMPSQYGSPIWAGHRPRTDSAAVALARRAGMVVAGKTVTTEFATRFPGPTTNPHDPRHTPGGSSSGSAAGVAAGFFPLAIATQTGGSVIRPAAFCGVHGFKPSFGAIHRGGMKVMSESLDTIGLMARSLDDIALGMQALTGRDHGRPSERPGRAPRIGVTMGPGESLCGEETRALLGRVEEAARCAGATVEAFAMPAECAEANALHPFVMNMESHDALAWEMDHARSLLSPVLREKMEDAMAADPAKLVAGRAAFVAARRAMAAAMEGFDALLTASAPGEAPEGIGWTGDPGCNSLWTALHLPCVTVPAGEGPKGLPLGVQVVAAEDGEALRWAAWVEAAL
ncbi:amidase [Sabulicella glaciei]|uniref:Amidase n=1 Tax=Sabulicella glaciei TaxID=2984948 RepID=A0ABT3NVW2_9PROT|nr:amidase [Roseococcus sp. MDT2-1-1]MCW8086306.1 amidase [Roseococcus sp. MDT2-1-1]